MAATENTHIIYKNIYSAWDIYGIKNMTHTQDISDNGTCMTLRIYMEERICMTHRTSQACRAPPMESLDLSRLGGAQNRPPVFQCPSTAGLQHSENKL